MIEAKGRDFKKSELGWEVRSRNAVRRSWNLERSQHEQVDCHIELQTFCFFFELCNEFELNDGKCSKFLQARLDIIHNKLGKF